MTRIAIAALLALALGACDDTPAGKSTTKLDAVEVQPGTISDSMIILDNAAGDGTAVDNSVPDDGTAKAAAAPDAEENAEDDGDDDRAESGDDPAENNGASAAPAEKDDSE